MLVHLRDGGSLKKQVPTRMRQYPGLLALGA